jgi:hypothetical protein
MARHARYRTPCFQGLREFFFPRRLSGYLPGSWKRGKDGLYFCLYIRVLTLGTTYPSRSVHYIAKVSTEFPFIECLLNGYLRMYLSYH